MNVIIDLFYASYVESVQVYFRKFFQLNQLIVLCFDMEQKSNTLNIQILFLWQNVCNLLLASNLFYIHHIQIATNLSTDIYKNLLLLNRNTHLWRNDFSIQ